jgi:hypothetical protein
MVPGEKLDLNSKAIKQALLFWKKAAMNFDDLSPRPARRPELKSRKFFGSFFQKSTPC